MSWYTWMIIWIGVIIIAFIFARCTKREDRKIYEFKKANLNKDEEEFMNLFNTYRIEHGYQMLQIDQTASVIQRIHVLYMIQNNEISHDNLDLRRKDLVSLGALNVGEIVGGKYRLVENLFIEFTESPEHNAVLMDDTVNVCGISLEENDKGEKFIAVITFKI